MTVSLLLAAVVARSRVWTRRRSHTVPATAVVDVATLLGIAVDGGMGLAGAIGWSVGYAHPSVRPGLDAALRDSARLGLAGALRAAEGPAAILLRSLARPVATGAAVGPVLAGLRERLESEYVAVIEERLERLPVKLLLPLALLMLPGLLLMIVAPALIDSIGRLG